MVVQLAGELGFKGMGGQTGTAERKFNFISIYNNN
jgi:hypothetical protein